jgi:hypothetical protein
MIQNDLNIQFVLMKALNKGKHARYMKVHEVER